MIPYQNMVVDARAAFFSDPISKSCHNSKVNFQDIDCGMNSSLSNSLEASTEKCKEFLIAILWKRRGQVSLSIMFLLFFLEVSINLFLQVLKNTFVQPLLIYLILAVYKSNNNSCLKWLHNTETVLVQVTTKLLRADVDLSSALILFMVFLLL